MYTVQYVNAFIMRIHVNAILKELRSAMKRQGMDAFPFLISVSLTRKERRATAVKAVGAINNLL